VKHPTPVIALAILATLAMSGCTQSTPGAANTTSRTTKPSTRPSSMTTADPLASVNPCSLLDPAVVSQNQLQPDKSGTGPGTRYCRWDTGATASGVGYNIAINIYDGAGLDQLSTIGFTVTNDPVGQHSGRMSKDTVGGTCAVSIGVTSTSRVDVVAVDSGGQLDRACVVATAVAPSVERKLPVEGN
jgi:Protein of unknown function (DUF3558)